MTRWRSWNARLGMPGPWHVRHDRPDGSKVVSWQTASGEPGLGDHRLEDLIYLTPVAADARATYWRPAVVVLTEGERAADAVAAAGFLGVGTVCGASSIPGSA